MKSRSKWSYAETASRAARKAVILHALSETRYLMGKEKESTKAYRAAARYTAAVSKVVLLAYEAGKRAGCQAEKDRVVEAQVLEMALRDAHYAGFFDVGK